VASHGGGGGTYRQRSRFPVSSLLQQAGDRNAFAALLERHNDRVHTGWPGKLTGSRADADDIAQDVCCALVEKIGTFRGDAKFSTWLTE
jgi:RNA polymerase sigma-70 factor (ECF subfamily)